MATINFSGLGSSIQWGDIVDATIEAEKVRNLTPITAEIEKRTAQQAAWTKLQGLVETLNENARLVRRTGFGGFTANVPTSPATSRTLLTATPTLNAVPGRYRVEVLQLADTAKLAGGAVTDVSSALNLTGDFSINGTSVAIDAADSLNAIRDKINTANSGDTPTGVTATIVKEGTTGGRLVLTRDASGADGITLADGTGGMARELGLLDSRSKPVTSAVVAAAAALGLVVTPPPATIRVGNVVITADLSVDSISAIAAKINAAGGSATVESEVYGDETRYRLVTDGNVRAVDGDANSQAVIDGLGMVAGASGAVTQTVQSGAYTDAADAAATAGTLLAGLKLDGADAGLAVGDAVNIRGLRGDGTAVTIGLVVEAGDTMQTLLDRINDATSGFGAGARPALATLGDDGRIRLADGQGGSSRLSMSLGITRADGSAGTLGATTVAIAGRSRELQQARDAVIRVDGQEYTRSSNSITDAIAGTTLSLQTAEPGTTIDVSIERDIEGGLATVQKFADSYNAIRVFFDEQRQTDSPLYADSLLRGVVESFTAALRTEVSANGTYSKLAMAGVALDRFGALKVDADALKTAMADKPTEIEALFGFTGVGGAFVTAADNATQFGIGTISAQLKNLSQASIRLKQRETDAQKRLDYRREQLVAQFTQMEIAISRLNQQRSSLASITSALQNDNS